MRYLSVCSGIEAASVAWGGLMQPVAFSEIEPFPSAVLAARFPDVPNLGDMNNFKEWNFDEAIDVLVGGTPCQSFSVAGLREGLSDPRGNLALVYCGILERFKPKWFVWENVPGVLSSWSGDTPSSLGISPGPGRTMEMEETSDFASILGAFSELGYGVAWRSFDAQYFGVPQRRRRVFVVGHLGDWRRAAAVLFERESMRRDSSKGPDSKQAVAKTLRGRANSSHREDSDNFVTHALRGEGFDANEDGTGRGTPLVAHACLAKGGSGRLDPSCETFVSCTLPASDGGVSSGMHPVIAFDTTQPDSVLTPSMAVRRLTPRECERLQGFPDDWTLIDYRGKPACDCPRYKAIGNSFAVPVVRWIGERIVGN